MRTLEMFFSFLRLFNYRSTLKLRHKTNPNLFINISLKTEFAENPGTE
jgi:hypothetical protein